MPAVVDLTPFGFTPTESQVYGALLRLGPSTGYAVAHATRVAPAAPRAEGVLAAELLRPSLPAWRRARERATVDLRVAGDVPDEAGTLVAGSASSDTPTILLIDDGQAVVASGAGDAVAAIWSSHPPIVAGVRLALRSLA